ncbi:unnamed protein product, partial [Laminaria digitata]
MLYYTKVGPVVLDPEVALEVGELIGESVAVFGGLVRRDAPGETARVRVEVGREQVRVIVEPSATATAAAAAATKTTATAAATNEETHASSATHSGGGDGG